MLDIKDIRRSPDTYTHEFKRRGHAPQVLENLLEMDATKRTLEADLQVAETRRNELNKLVAAAGKAGDKATLAQLRDEAVTLKQRMPVLDGVAKDAAQALEAHLLSLPNILHATVPKGTDESSNLVILTQGNESSQPWHRPHWEFGPALGMDTEGGVALAGSRFTLLRGPMARLSRVLGQWMLDTVVDLLQAEEMVVPQMVLPHIAQGTGQLPKFTDDLFWAGERDSTGHVLIPTAEVPLTNTVRGRALQLAEGEALRMAALSACYRMEAGGAGRDSRGLIRQHQFDKVEMVTVCRPDDADTEEARMLGTAEAVLRGLELPYRRVLLCAGDTGFSAARTHDLEVWMPGLSEWREISSISTCSNFQARRMGTRFKDGGLPHTLNGSAVAVGRAIAAILENGLREDGRVRLPAALLEHGGMGKYEVDECLYAP